MNYCKTSYTHPSRLNSTRVQDIISSSARKNLERSQFPALVRSADENSNASIADSVKSCLTGALIATAIVSGVPPDSLAHSAASGSLPVLRYEDRYGSRDRYRSTEYVRLGARSNTGSIFSRQQVTIYDLITYIRNYITLSFESKIANRIETLFEESIKEEDAGQQVLNQESLICFISFLQNEKKLKEPGLVLSARGNIRAQWRSSRKNLFVAEFIPGGRVRYVVFAENKDFPSKLDRASGLTSYLSLMNIVEPFGAKIWATS